ncbi:10373_t:CDS:2 [Entrophospora sp. SA101]|nr:10373_t:CDS:2 [Entrophospora sp. SA101]
MSFGVMNNLHQNDGRQRVWHLPKEKYDVDCLVPTFKHGGGDVMVWGCFVNNCLGPLVVIDGKINVQTCIEFKTCVKVQTCIEFKTCVKVQTCIEFKLVLNSKPVLIQNFKLASNSDY